MSVLQLYFGPVTVVALALLVVAIVAVTQAVVVVDAYEQHVLTVFGEYRTTLEPGINIVPPFVSATHAFDMRTQRLELSVETVTGDRWSVTADAAVDVQVEDPETAFHETEDYRVRVEELATETLRGVLRDVDRETLLEDRTAVNDRVRAELDDRLGEFGMRAESVDIRDVTAQHEVDAVE